jgi:hypothetical protein
MKRSDFEKNQQRTYCYYEENKYIYKGYIKNINIVHCIICYGKKDDVG